MLLCTTEPETVERRDALRELYAGHWCSGVMGWPCLKALVMAWVGGPCNSEHLRKKITCLGGQPLQSTLQKKHRNEKKTSVMHAGLARWWTAIPRCLYASCKLDTVRWGSYKKRHLLRAPSKKSARVLEAENDGIRTGVDPQGIIEHNFTQQGIQGEGAIHDGSRQHT